MLSTMSLIKEKYGGTTQYLTGCGLREEDLSRIQDILTDSVSVNCPAERA
jgi:hypothetical protein